MATGVYIKLKGKGNARIIIILANIEHNLHLPSFALLSLSPVQEVVMGSVLVLICSAISDTFIFLLTDGICFTYLSSQSVSVYGVQPMNGWPGGTPQVLRNSNSVKHFLTQKPFEKETRVT